MAFATVGTSKVEYLVDGSGAGLVLVHGTGLSWLAMWLDRAEKSAASLGEMRIWSPSAREKSVTTS